MGALEQGLRLAQPEQPSAAPAPPPAAAPVAPAGALGRAIALTRGAEWAMSQDPLAALATQAAQEDMAARAEAARGVEANMAEKAAVMAEPDPPRPAVPRLTPLPEAPEPVKRDPLRVFGQFLPMVAALGALATKQPAVNALNAATAMVNAAKNNDKEETERQRTAWLDNLRLTIQGNNQMLGEYKLALEDRNASMQEKLAKVQAIAAQNQDLLTLSTLRGGNLESLSKLQQLRMKGVEQLTDVALTLERQDFEQKKFEQQQILGWAELEIRRRQTENVSMGDSIGPVLLKIRNAGPAAAEGLDKVLTPGEIAALKTYMDINAGRTFANQPGQPQAAGGLAALGGLTPPAPPSAAATAQAAGAGRSGAAPTPVTAPPSGNLTAAPQNAGDRVVGQWYGTPRGPARWMGDGWELPPGK